MPKSAKYSLPAEHIKQLEDRCRAECRDLILSTADFLEFYYKRHGCDATLPNWSKKWMTHLLARANTLKLPITRKILTQAMFFTIRVRQNFDHANRRMVYYPYTPSPPQCVPEHPEDPNHPTNPFKAKDVRRFMSSLQNITIEMNN
ncbi:hypothetical protein B9Z55_011545 [Caenorhabditis nigoni]|uniref:Uncharacterized protein n=1 Tax=Caenorhabditis nigoni TaxID=1611254 RepID=A0A2G5UKJ4_9PELO|nr:hypothetical protein B9Z55_011545 [Caenorhabditis nigoni]